MNVTHFAKRKRDLLELHHIDLFVLSFGADKWDNDEFQEVTHVPGSGFDGSDAVAGQVAQQASTISGSVSKAVSNMVRSRSKELGLSEDNVTLFEV